MQLDNSFSVSKSPAETWKILLDVPLIASCVPGAELIAEEGENRYKGKIAVRLGPVALSFKGTAQLCEMDDTNFRALLKANGMDEKGRGTAGSVSRISIEPIADGSKVKIATDLNLSGSVAQYGRASGIINAVANEIVSVFAKNLRSRLDADAPQATVAEVSDGEDVRRPVPRNNTLGAGLFVRAFAAWLKGLFGRSA